MFQRRTVGPSGVELLRGCFCFVTGGRLIFASLIHTQNLEKLSRSYRLKMPRRKKEEEALLSDKDRVPRGAANARERTRMRILSKAFGRLKLTLPWVPPDTKLSKLDTLRLATSYISHLKRILDDEEDDGEDGGKPDPGSSISMVSQQLFPPLRFFSLIIAINRLRISSE